MYEDYFSLSGPAFRLSPDPKFFFGSQTHNKAMAYLYYGLKQAEGFVVITGDVGAGKTILVGHLLDQLHYSAVTAAHLQASDPRPDALLAQILSVFGVERENRDGAGDLNAFEHFLFEELKRGRHVLLIVDEAQNLPLETLEKLRALSSIDYEGTPLFQVFLMGRPEFGDRLRRSEMNQMRQRVIASYRLDVLTREETHEYILHRLSVAGWREDPVFSDDAINLIHQETAGAPRRINLLCNRIMLFSAVEKRHEVTRETVEAVLAEMHKEPLEALSGDSAPHVDLNGATSVEDAAPKEPQSSSLTSSSSSDGHEVDGVASEFDRLIASRHKPAASQPPSRQEATLSDVASAIAAAANGESSFLNDEDDPDGLPKRETVGRSLDGMREDLKEAGEMIAALRSVRDERAAILTSSMTRADDLIAQVRRLGRATN